MDQITSNQTTNETLDDLVKRGLAIRQKRIAENRIRQLAEEAARAAQYAEDYCLICNLLPPSLAQLAKVEIRGKNADVYVTQPFPGSGTVKVNAKKDAYGHWSLCDYEATNPDGYYLKLQTLEESVAYASGVLEI